MITGSTPLLGDPVPRNDSPFHAEPGAERQLPRVTAVVLNWCGEEDTVACLRSLLESDYAALRILLVDNGSPDGSGPRLHERFPEIPYLQIEQNIGYTGGNNEGIRHALAQDAEYVLVLNNDTVLEPSCISELVEAARSRPGVGGVAPKILYRDEPERIWYAGGTFSRLRAIGSHRKADQLDQPDPRQTIENVTFLSGCCVLLPAGVLHELGGFREDFFAYVEDVELSSRLTSAGYTLIYQPRARLLHRVPLPPVEPSPLQIFLRDRNRRRFVRGSYRLPERLAFACFFYPSRVIRLIGYLLRRDGIRARAIWRGMAER